MAWIPPTWIGVVGIAHAEQMGLQRIFGPPQVGFGLIEGAFVVGPDDWIGDDARGFAARDAAATSESDGAEEAQRAQHRDDCPQPAAAAALFFVSASTRHNPLGQRHQ